MERVQGCRCGEAASVHGGDVVLGLVDEVTVNLVHPGPTRTERINAETERRAASNAIRRIVDAQEIAQVVAFLASTKAANVTGLAIDASGGSIPVMFQ